MLRVPKSQTSHRPLITYTYIILLALLACGAILLGVVSWSAFDRGRPGGLSQPYDRSFVKTSNQAIDGYDDAEADVATMRVHNNKDPGDTAIILPWFQALQYERPLSNMLVQQHDLERLGLPYFISELVVEGGTPRFYGPNVFYFTSNVNFLWQKEALVVAAVRKLPAHFTKVVWLDKDVRIGNDSWLLRVSELLEHDYHAVQPFEAVCLLPPNFRGCLRLAHYKSSAWEMENGCPMTKKMCGHPGMALALRREIVQELGLLERMLIGSGDQLMVNALYNIPEPAGLKDITSIIATLGIPYDGYRHALHRMFGEPLRVGYLKGVVAFHRYHGARSNRQHKTRFQMLLESGFNHTHFYRGADGLWMVYEPKRWEKVFLTFFDNRSEDDIDPEDLQDATLMS